MFELDLRDIAELADDFDEAADELPRNLEESMRTIARFIERRAGMYAEASRSNKPPHLADSFHVRVRRDSGGNRVWAIVYNDMPYSAGAEWGSQGKWSGFNKYGPAGNRFATRAANDVRDSDDLEDAIIEEVLAPLVGN